MCSKVSEKSNHMRNKAALSFIAILIIMFFATGCAKQAQPVQRTGFMLDTVITVTVYQCENNDADDIISGAFDICSYYESIFSNTVSGSDISRINCAGGRTVTVSEDTSDILKTAVRYSELTDGAFDVTISPVSALWDFKSGKAAVPDESRIREALTHVDYRNIVISGNTVCLKDPEAAIDLGGIAKGYIADRMKEYMVSHGTDSAIINLGGNIDAIGENTDRTEFNIGIQKPFAEQNEIITAVKIKDLSVVSSGPYERYFERDGRIYHHILDTDTGYPAETGLNGVTILSERSVDGDALSTSCFVLGYEKGKKLIQEMNRTDPSIKAVFIDSENRVE